MTLHQPIPIDLRLRDLAGDDEPRLYAPIGHDAPKHSVEWANYQAARLAASEVYGKAVHCPIHRASLEAWQRGERSWPWPDATDEDRAVADHALLRALRMPDDEFDRVVSGQRRWNREFGR